MSMRYKGAVLSATAPTTSSSSAVGVWTMRQQLQAIGGTGWPQYVAPISGNVGAQAIISADYTRNPFVTSVDDGKKVLVGYQNLTTSNNVVKVGTLTGNTVSSWGSEANIGAGRGIKAMCTLSPTLALVAGYFPTGDGFYVAAVTISGTSASIGSLTTSTSVIVYGNVSLISLSTTTALLRYTDYTNYVTKAVIVTVSGTNCSLGTAVTINSYTAGDNSLAKFSNTDVRVLTGGSPTYTSSTPATVSGTTITAGTLVTSSSLGQNFASATTVDGTYMALGSSESSPSPQNKIRLVNASGSAGSIYGVAGEQVPVCCNSTVPTAIQFGYMGTGFSVLVDFLTVSGSSLSKTAGTSTQTLSAASSGNYLYGTSMCYLTVNTAAVVYQVNSGSSNSLAISILY